MSSPISVVEGEFISITHNPYEFTEQGSGEVRRGTSHRLWISTGTDQPPTEITVKDGSPLMPGLDALEAGDRLTARCEIFANTKGRSAVLSMRLLSYEPALIGSEL